MIKLKKSFIAAALAAAMLGSSTGAQAHTIGVRPVVSVPEAWSPEGRAAYEPSVPEPWSPEGQIDHTG